MSPSIMPISHTTQENLKTLFPSHHSSVAQATDSKATEPLVLANLIV